jgi:hypothetical protein
MKKLLGWESPFAVMVVSYTSQNPCPINEIPSNFHKKFSALTETPELMKC